MFLYKKAAQEADTLLNVFSSEEGQRALSIIKGFCSDMDGTSPELFMGKMLVYQQIIGSIRTARKVRSGEITIKENDVDVSVGFE